MKSTCLTVETYFVYMWEDSCQSSV